jgi:hypothetical protein
MVRPLFWPNASVNADATQEKRAVYRQQFDELMQDKNNGRTMTPTTTTSNTNTKSKNANMLIP